MWYDPLVEFCYISAPPKPNRCGSPFPTRAFAPSPRGTAWFWTLSQVESQGCWEIFVSVCVVAKTVKQTCNHLLPLTLLQWKRNMWTQHIPTSFLETALLFSLNPKKTQRKTHNSLPPHWDATLGHGRQIATRSTHWDFHLGLGSKVETSGGQLKLKVFWIVDSWIPLWEILM